MERGMNPALVKVIAKAIEELVEMILLDDTPQSEIVEIKSQKGDWRNPHQWIVYANLDNGKGGVYSYKYAIYIDVDTLHAETDGF